MNIAVVFAGGSGVRMGAGVPKQFLEIEGKPILIHTLRMFEMHHKIDKIYLAVMDEYIPYEVCGSGLVFLQFPKTALVHRLPF